MIYLMLKKCLTKNDELIIITKEKANDTTIKLMKHLYDTEGSLFSEKSRNIFYNIDLENVFILIV